MDDPAQAPLSAIALPLLAFVITSLLVVWVMVQFSRAFLARDSFSPAGSSPVARWGAAYLLAWAGLIAALLYLLERLGEPLEGKNLLLLVGIVASWFAMHTVLLWFTQAIMRANTRQSESASKAGSRREDRRRAETVPPPEPRRAQSAPRTRSWVSSWKLARNFLLVLLIVAIAEAIPPLRAAGDWIAARQPTLLLPAIVVAAVGFLLLMGGAIHMVLTAGRPMSRQEIERFQRQARERDMGPALWRRAVVRSGGMAIGAQADETVSFAEVKQAFRLRAWWFIPYWRRFFLMMAGTTFMLFGIFGVMIVLAPVGIKLICVFAVVYVVIQAARGLARA